MKKLSTLLFLFSVLFAVSAFAEDKDDLIKLKIQEKAFTEVKPDRFTSIIEFEDIDYSAQDAQEEVNKQIEAAVRKLKLTNLKYELGSFSAYKEYDSNKFKAHQTISLESKDVAKLEELTSELVKLRGKVTSTGSYVSEQAKETYFQNLFEQAYTQATNKARFILKTVKGKSYKITDINYYFNNQVSPRFYRAKAMMAESSVNSAPDINIDNSEKKISLDLTLSIGIEQ